MVLLHFRTDNLANLILAKFDSIYDEAYIQFSNVNKFIYYAGLSNNSIKIYNPNNPNDIGVLYNNNILSVQSVDIKTLRNFNNTIFPNSYTLLNEYQFTEPTVVSLADFTRAFDFDNLTIWRSASVYTYPNGTSITNDPNFKFKDSYGHYIKIKFPYAIIPIGFSVNSVVNLNDPDYFDVYVSNDNINWTRILDLNAYNISSGEYYFNNNELYYYITIVITRIKIDPSTPNINQNFNIREFKVFSKPILNVDTKIKISDNHIYNLNSINTKKILLNDVPLNSIGDINSLIITQALDAFKSQYSLYWSNNNRVAYYDPNIISKLAINKSTADATLDINGDIAYNNRSLTNKIVINNSIYNYSSSYVYIGKITFYNNTKNYFKLSIYLYEHNKYYFQSINIYGYSLLSTDTTGFNNIFNAYWDTSYDNTNGIQRIVEVVYLYDTIFTNQTSIKFYIRYNDALDIFNANRNVFREYIYNNIYIDAFNTSSSSEINFYPFSVIPETLLNDPNLNIFKAILINSTILNKNGCSFSNMSINNLKLTNSINSYNLLMIDNNKIIKDSGISSNLLIGLTNLTGNKIVATDSIGNLTTLNISANLLSNIEFNSRTDSRILISSNNLYEAFAINKNNLSNLNNIHITPNSILFINELNQLKTTTRVKTNNISNVLELFNFNTNNGYAICNSNININNFSINSNLYIGNNIITSNYKYNRITVNNREIADDIFKLLIRIPGINDKILAITDVPNNNNYIINLESGFNITLDIENSDDNPDITKKVYNIMKKSKDNYWLTQANFLSYIGTNYGAEKKLYNDFTGITRCGAYLIIDIGQPFVLSMYSIYVNYTNINSSIRDFKLFAYSSNNTWVLLDSKENQIFNNNLIPNNFKINKNNYELYSKYALCIVNTHNTSATAVAVAINSIELFGYPINNYYHLSSNTITYNNENNYMTYLGYSNIGINNINPYTFLSIGNDIDESSRHTLLNLNHSAITTSMNIEKPIINITRPSSNLNINGIKVSHYINSWYESNTNYSIKLSHNRIDNEKLVLSMNSDGKIAIGGHPDCNLSNNGLSLFNTGINFHSNNKYVNFSVSNITSNYNIIFPPIQGIYDTTFFIDKVNCNNIYLNFDDPVEKMVRKPHIKFGNQTITKRNANGVVIQIAGNTLIGTNNLDALTDDYLRHTLCVAGTIYSTIDITTDSDISYKYNIKLIKDPLDKINRISGYTFNRYDTNDDNRYTGLIAQEVIKVMPEVIIKKHDGKYRIIYNNLAGLFVESIKELDNKLNYLNIKINLAIAVFAIGFIYLIQ